MNKRGDVSVVILVLLTFVLFTYILIAINIDASKVSGNFLAVSKLNDFYAEQEGYENTLYFRLVEVSLDSYYETLSESASKIGEVDNLDLNEIFRKKVELKFKSDVEAPEKVKDLFSDVNTFSFDGRRVFIGSSLKDIEKSMSSSLNDNSKIFYRSSLNSSFDLKSVDLPTFNELIEAYNYCNYSANFDNVDVCLNGKLKAFNAVVKCEAVGALGVQDPTKADLTIRIPNPIRYVELPNQDIFKNECYVNVTSKDSYYIDKEMKKIGFVLNFGFTKNPPL